MIPRQTWPGTWIDVVGDVYTRAFNRQLFIGQVGTDGKGVDTGIYECPEVPMFHRHAVAPDSVVAVFSKGHDSGVALLSLPTGTLAIGTTNGNNPGAIYWNGTEFICIWTEFIGLFGVYGSVSGRLASRPIPAPYQGTSQGILDLRPDGSVMLMDEFRTLEQPPWSFTKPNERDGFHVGQWGYSGKGHPELNRIIVGLPDGATVFTGILDTADDPRLSVHDTGRLLITAMTPQGATLQVIDRPYPPAEQPPTPTPAPDGPLPKIGRPCWIGWFNFTDFPTPGSLVVAIRHIEGPTHKATIVSNETLGVLTQDLILGHFIGGDSVSEIEAQAQVLAHRPVAYWDARRWPSFPKLPDGAWFCVRAYCLAGETPVVFEADMRRVLDGCPSIPIALVCQQYTSNTDLTTDIKPLIPVFLRLARDYSRVIALLNFSGYGRDGGLEDHPELVPIWEQVVKDTAVPTIPSYPIVTPPIPPQPSSPYRKHTYKGASMTDTIGAIRGPGGKLGRPDEKGTGIWNQGTSGSRGLVFDGGNDKKGTDDRYSFIRRGDTPNSLVSKQTGGIVGCDSTANSGGLNKQFYIKPDGDTGQGWAETFQFYDGNANGAIQAVVEYAPGSGGDDGPFFSYPFAFEVIK